MWIHYPFALKIESTSFKPFCVEISWGSRPRCVPESTDQPVIINSNVYLYGLGFLNNKYFVILQK